MNRVTFSSTIKDGVEVKLPCPGDATFFINVGEKVNVGQKLYSLSQREIKDSFYIPSALGVKIEESKEYVGRVGGEYVTKGDLLAERLASGGLITKKIFANSDGIISTSRLNKGFLDIVGEYEEIVVNSEFEAVVKEIIVNNHITFESKALSVKYIASKNLTAKSSNLFQEISGELVLVGEGDSVTHHKHLESSYNNKIVFAGRFLYSDLAVELYRRGAVAVIAYSINYDQFRELSVPVLLLSGFGQLKVNEGLLQIFSNNIGKTVKIDQERGEIHIVGGNGIKEKEVQYKGNTYFVGVVEDGKSLLINDGERFSSVGTKVPLNESALEDEGYIGLRFKDGGTTIVHSESVSVLAE